QIKNLKDLHNNKINEQVALFQKHAQKLLPIFQFIQSKGYRFHNPNKEIKYFSIRGPVLAYDRQEHKLFVYGVTENRIIEVDLSGEKSSLYSHYAFFEQFSFEDAINGLHASLNVQLNLINEFNKDINARDDYLRKYSINPQ
ncbi:MAG: hypothetical protein J7559_14265, partial [Cohnella sp.]|nr:hypothetical protein [Cohnella sp.]